MSQKEKILEYLIMIPGRRISTWQAYELFHCTTLAQRCADIREQLRVKPIIINNERYMLKDELVCKEGKTFSEYWLEPVRVQESLFA